MVIDIISYTDTQYALMSEEQILEIRAAQLKKNRLSRALAEKLQTEKAKLVENGTLSSDMWKLIEEKLKAEYEEEVGWIRDSLLFYLRFVMKFDENSVDYEVNYALSIEERLQIVEDYYMQTYTDAKARFDAYKEDKVARVYLGERYSSLYDHFLYLSKV